MRDAALKLRRATVLELRGVHASEQSLVVRLEDGEERQAIVDLGLHGHCEVGDELIVNVQALDLGLGSGGFDIVHVNLTKGLEGSGICGAHVMKLNYTSLQHAVRSVEESEDGAQERMPGRPPRVVASVAVLALHGQLAPVAWAFSRAAPDAKLGFIQTQGGALSGGHSRVVRELLDRKLLAGHITAGAAFGGESEAITLAGALQHASNELGWDAVICGPGPGIVGSGSTFGHGGMQALESAHTAMALGTRTLIVARMSCTDGRERHRGVSHHTLTVLELLLRPVTVALPEGVEIPNEVGHDLRRVCVDTASYGESGLPVKTMGRSLTEDPVFFEAALCAGAVLGELRKEDDVRRTTR